MRAPVAREGRRVRVFPGGHARPLRRGPDATTAAGTRSMRCRRCRPSLGRTRATSCELSENADATERAVLLELEPSETIPLHVDPIEGISGLFFADHQSGTSSGVRTGRRTSPSTSRRSTGPVALTHHVQSFFQGNRYLLPELVSRVLAQVPEGTVTDLYAGVGLFAASLAAQGQRQIVAVEGDRSSARDLESNADAVRLGHSRAASLGRELSAAAGRAAA